MERERDLAHHKATSSAAPPVNQYEVFEDVNPVVDPASRVHQMARIDNLHGAPEFNGTLCKVESYDANN